jgi:hypothetical protein
MPVMPIPGRPFEGPLARDHRSADGAPPGLRAQERGPQPRRRAAGQVAGTVLTVRLPGRRNGVGVAFSLALTLRGDRLPNADALLSADRSGEPPGFPRLRGGHSARRAPAQLRARGALWPTARAVARRRGQGWRTSRRPAPGGERGPTPVTRGAGSRGAGPGCGPRRADRGRGPAPCGPGRGPCGASSAAWPVAPTAAHPCARLALSRRRPGRWGA